MTIPTYDNAGDRLESLLPQVQKAVQRGQLQRVESLLAQTSDLIQTLQTHPLPADQRTRLQRAYQQLMLILEVQKQTTGEQLHQLRGGKRIVKTYRGTL